MTNTIKIIPFLRKARILAVVLFAAAGCGGGGVLLNKLRKRAREAG